MNILKETNVTGLKKVQVKATPEPFHSAFSIERVATKLLPQYQPKSNRPILILHEKYSDKHSQVLCVFFSFIFIGSHAAVESVIRAFEKMRNQRIVTLHVRGRNKGHYSKPLSLKY